MSQTIDRAEPARRNRALGALIRNITPGQLWVDITLAALFMFVFGPLSLAVLVDDSVSVGVVVTVMVVMALALAVRRLSPALALAIAWAGAIFQMACGAPPLPANIAIFGVLYVTAAYGTRLVVWLGFASTLVGAGAVTLYLFLVAFMLNAAGAWQVLFLGTATYLAVAFAFALAWTIGMLVRTAQRAKRTKLAQALAEREVVIEQERGRIARDMHDVVAHSLAVVIAQADGARYAARTDPATASEALGTIAHTARGALADVRLLLTQLRHNEGVGPQPTLGDLEQLYAQVRAAGADVRVEVAPTPVGSPPAALQLAVYRILQEALTNALRHGDGKAVEVRLAWHPERVEIEVRNAVVAGTESRPAGHGLVGMIERASLVGGRLDASAHDGTFVVAATLPIGAPA